LAIATVEIATPFKSARKRYFLSRLAEGIPNQPQYELPLSRAANLDLPVKENAETKPEPRLVRIHMEEDAGKNIHYAGRQLARFNRSGVPLMEIVSEPDLRFSGTGPPCLRELRSVRRYSQLSDGNMEKGVSAAMPTVSVRKRGEQKARRQRTENQEPE